MLPEDVIAHEIEASMANELDALDWPMTNAAAEVKAGNARQVSAGRSKDHLLSKVSMWDAKVRDEVKKKEELQATEALIHRNKLVNSGVDGSRFSPSKGADSLNTGSPSKDGDGTRDPPKNKMDASTAHMVIMNPGNDPDRLREAIEVSKSEATSVLDLPNYA
jgi:hypothetical protein